MVPNHEPSRIRPRRQRNERVSERRILKVKELGMRGRSLSDAVPGEVARAAPDLERLVAVLVDWVAWLRRLLGFHDDVDPGAVLGRHCEGVGADGGWVAV